VLVSSPTGNGYDDHMTDPDQPGEELDESLGGDYPPDHPPHLDDDGGTEPEVWEAPAAGSGEGVELLGDPDVDATGDDESELLGASVEDDPAHGPLAPDDEISGDETTRDFATEHVTTDAEEAAIHIEDDEAT
jgi:hypothetical protein